MDERFGWNVVLPDVVNREAVSFNQPNAHVVVVIGIGDTGKAHEQCQYHQTQRQCYGADKQQFVVRFHQSPCPSQNRHYSVRREASDRASLSCLTMLMSRKQKQPDTHPVVSLGSVWITLLPQVLRWRCRLASRRPRAYG